MVVLNVVQEGGVLVVTVAVFVPGVVGLAVEDVVVVPTVVVVFITETVAMHHQCDNKICKIKSAAIWVIC